MYEGIINAISMSEGVHFFRKEAPVNPQFGGKSGFVNFLHRLL